MGHFEGRPLWAGFWPIVTGAIASPWPLKRRRKKSCPNGQGSGQLEMTAVSSWTAVPTCPCDPWNFLPVLREDGFLLRLALMTFYVALRLPSLHHGPERLWWDGKNVAYHSFLMQSRSQLLALKISCEGGVEIKTIYDYFVWLGFRLSWPFCPSTASTHLAVINCDKMSRIYLEPRWKTWINQWNRQCERVDNLIEPTRSNMAFFHSLLRGKKKHNRPYKFENKSLTSLEKAVNKFLHK